MSAAGQVLAALIASLDEPSCGTAAWDHQAALNASLRTGWRMEAVGDGRLLAILRRCQPAAARFTAGAAAGLHRDCLWWQSAEKRVLRFLRSAVPQEGKK